jgi:integrase
VRDYLDAMRAYLSDGTRSRKARNLRTIHRDLEALGLAKTPLAITEGDVETLLAYWKKRECRRRHKGPLDRSTIAKYLNDFDGFLAWCGNSTIANLRRKYRRLLPKATSKPIVVLDEDDLERLRRAAETIDGWRGVVARFIVVFMPNTGLRPKEFRLARLEDVDLKRWQLRVSHPKGEDAWAVPDFAPILPPARDALHEFLVEREAFLAGETCETLVPYRCKGGLLVPWDDAVLHKLKAELARASGVDFSLKSFRATFAQSLKDRGVRGEAVSRAMRHASTLTTERYYARLRASDAFREIERAFEKPFVRVDEN